MASIPLTFRSAPFPEGYKADPEQMKNDLVARLYAESTESISFFASGSVAPSSNVGPWLKNGEEWYIWSSTLAMYVPQVLDPTSLGYVAQLAAPDPAVYTFWIELDGAGKAIAIKYYSGGAWKDVYEDKFALYLTIAAAAAAYQPLNANLTTITTSTLGDVIYSSAANTLAKLAGNTAAAKRFLTQTGTGAVSAAPVWSAIVAGDIPDISATYKTVASFNSDIANYATLASPALTGVPTSPTAAPGTNTTQISTTEFVTAAIAAIPPAASFTSSPAKAVLAGTQTVAINATPQKLLFASEVFDPNSVYDAGNSKYVAPATGYYQVFAELQVDNNGGTASGMEIELHVYVNGGAVHTQGLSVASPPGSRWYPSVSALVQATSAQDIEIYMEATDGVDSGSLDVAIASSFSVNRIPQS